MTCEKWVGNCPLNWWFVVLCWSHGVDQGHMEMIGWSNTLDSAAVVEWTGDALPDLTLQQCGDLILVGGLEHVLHTWGIIIPTDYMIFFRRVEDTNQNWFYNFYHLKFRWFFGTVGALTSFEQLSHLAAESHMISAPLGIWASKSGDWPAYPLVN